MNSRQLARTWPYKRYKSFEKELREAASNWFSQKGYETHSKMNYCLPAHNDWPKNIICEEVVQHIQNQRVQSLGEAPYPLHKYLHHGLSSQAMVFNLIGALIVRNDLEPLQAAFIDAGIEWPEGEVTASFEHEDRSVFNEDSGQPTSIDLLISGSSSLYIETKLSEREFGGCSVFTGGDCDGNNPCLNGGFSSCYLDHIGREYWVRLEEHGFIDSAFQLSPICPMANYYQFFREVLFALHNQGKFVLMHDKRNPAFEREPLEGKETTGLWPFLMKFVPDHQKQNVSRITIQQVVSSIETSGRHEDWIGEFKAKYGLTD